MNLNWSRSLKVSWIIKLLYIPSGLFLNLVFVQKNLSSRYFREFLKTIEFYYRSRTILGLSTWIALTRIFDTGEIQKIYLNFTIFPLKRQFFFFFFFNFITLLLCRENDKKRIIYKLIYRDHFEYQRNTNNVSNSVT